MIHQTAIIDPSAKIADDVEIGPYAIIGADVEIGSGNWIGPHVVINGPTKIGKNNKIYQFASLGCDPQDLKFAGEDTTVEINTNPDYRTILYQLDGKTEINGKKIGNKTMLAFDNDGSKIKISSLESARLLLLSGKPIDEEITSYGPFVMNSTTEIMEAIRDAQQGKMGVLIEEF